MAPAQLEGRKARKGRGGSCCGELYFIMKVVSMKRICFVSIILLQFLLAHAAPPDSMVWVQQQSGIHTTLWSVMFVDTMRGWACGDAGALVRTSDGGQHWQKSTAFTSRSINSVCFINPAVGWLVTDTAQVYKSTDSGATWSLQFSRPRAFFSDCLFFDDSTGFAAGSDMNGANMYNEGILYKTVNGGTTWTLAKSYLISIWSISSLAFPDRKHGWALGDYDLLKTTDGGFSWHTPVVLSAITDSAYIKTSGYINRIIFEDTLNGFGIGRNGHVIRTRNGGTSWTLVYKTSQWPEGISFADPAHAFIVGQNCVVMTSADSGASWEVGYPRPARGVVTPWFRDVVFKNLNNGWIVGDSGIIMKGSLYKLSTGVVEIRQSSMTRELLKISANSHSTITIFLAVNVPGTVHIDLRDLQGRTIANLASGPRSAGAYLETYSLTQSIHSGMYYVTVRGKKQFSCAKTAIVR
jgi:photosystem II stability/assembly factor-like uncharacterized protein